MIDKAALEMRIDQYINDHGLREGSVLPEAAELAQQLECGLQDIEEVLVIAEKKGKVKWRKDAPAIVLTPFVLHDEDAFSFTKSAEVLGNRVVTVLDDNEQIQRTPMEDGPLAALEKKVHQTLGLSDEKPFIVIVRKRLVEDVPRVIHRAYLRPHHFPASFLDDHDFAKESLIHIYHQYGYKLTSRNTTLRARHANLYEMQDLKIPAGKPILEAEQELFAINPQNGDPFVLEFLQASYLDWSYRIENRPAPQVE